MVSLDTPAARKAAIQKQWRGLCSRPLANDELERAAKFIETHRDKDAVWVTKKLLEYHLDAKDCLGQH